MALSFFATCPKGLETLLLNELQALIAIFTAIYLCAQYYEF